MKCDDCGAYLRPVVALDIDGTMSEYHTHLLRFIWDYFDISKFNKMDMVDNDGFCTWNGYGNFEDWIGITQNEYRQAKLAFRQGGFKRWSPLFHDMSGLYARAVSLGCDIWFATTRPWQRLDNVDPDTQEWLRRYALNYKGLIYGEDKYQQLVSNVGKTRVVLVVDDLLDQVEVGAALDLPIFQVARNHNLHPSAKSTRRASVDALTVVLDNSVEAYEREYGSDQGISQLNLLG